MTDHWHLFEIPVEGLFHVYHSDDEITDEYVAMVLAKSNPEPDEGEDPRPVPARIQVRVDDDEDAATIWFTPDPRLPTNGRALDIAAEAFGWYMIFHGSVLIRGLTEDQVATSIDKFG